MIALASLLAPFVTTRSSRQTFVTKVLLVDRTGPDRLSLIESVRLTNFLLRLDSFTRAQACAAQETSAASKVSGNFSWARTPA